MRCVILAGGLGSRLSEETRTIPKPMIEVGGKPILQHIMDIYKQYGVNDFIVAAGYKKQHILAYFMDCKDFKIVEVSYDDGYTEFKGFDLNVMVADTGQDTMTGGRLKRIAPYVDGERFLMTYGDGLANVNISSLVANHIVSNALVTLTAVYPVPRFGSLKFDFYGKVQEFSEKMVGDGDWINGGFFVIEPDALDYIRDDSTNWEKDVLPVLTKEEKLYAFVHTGYWQCVDTVRDLEKIREDYEKDGAVWLK